MKKIALLLIFIFTLSKSEATSIQVSGNITTNTFWNSDTVKIVGDVYLSWGDTLTIKPGTRIEFHGFYSINIYSSCFKAIGTITDSIYFAQFDTTQLYNQNVTNGGWKGIKLLNAIDSKLQYCSIQHMKNTSVSANLYQNHSIHIYDTHNFTISNCLITNNYTMLATPMTVNSTSNYHGSFGLIHISECSPLIQYNVISNNTAGKGIISSNNYLLGSTIAKPIIDQNIIYNNITWHGGGGIYCLGLGEETITSNFICNNHNLDLNPCYPNGGGISFDSKAYVANNVIANNTTAGNGGGIACWGDGIIINNTIVNNHAQMLGGGFDIKGKPDVKNNIVWGNTSTPSPTNQIALFDWYSGGKTDFSFSCIEGGANAIDFIYWGPYSGQYTNNIHSNPIFINPSNGSGHTFNGYTADWRLQLSSPCINTGTLNNLGNLPSQDCWHNPRIVGSSIDMGAYEAPTQSPDGINDLNNNLSVSIYPNPANENFTVNYTQNYSQATVAIVNTLGQVIENKTFNNSEKITFNSSAFAKGTYFLNLLIDDTKMNARVVIVE